MAVSVVPGSVKINVQTDLVKTTGVPLQAQNVFVCHFGNFAPATLEPGITWTAGATCELASPTPDALKTVDFGFIQLAEQGTLYIEYSGTKDQAGSIMLTPRNPPAWYRDFQLLDSKGDTGKTVSHRPWTRPPDRFQIDGNEVTSDTGDGPLISVALTVDNKATKVTNYLRMIVDERYFVTMFVKKDKSTTPSNEYLAHFYWKLEYRFELKWRKGKPTIHRNASTHQFFPVQAGRPSAPQYQKLLIEDNQHGPDYNEVAKASLLEAVTSGQPGNRLDQDAWMPGTPKDFYT